MDEVRQEIAEEAELFGPLKRVDIVFTSSSSSSKKTEQNTGKKEKEVEVHLCYTDSTNAMKAFRAMNGRIFGGRKIDASFGLP